MTQKEIPVRIEKADNPNYDARFVMSATAPDRVGDTIDPRAYKSNLEKRLICLWQHKSDQPIGYWDNLRVKSGELVGDLKIAATNLGQMVRALIEGDVPLGASIGFTGKGEVNEHGGVHFKELDLLECSVVSIPCHPLAVQTAKQLDLDLKELGIDVRPSDNDEPDNTTVSRDVGAVRKRAAEANLGAHRALKGKRK